MFDLFDLLVIVGLILLVAAVYLLASWPGLLGLAGGLLIAFGLAGANGHSA